MMETVTTMEKSLVEIHSKCNTSKKKLLLRDSVQSEEAPETSRDGKANRSIELTTRENARILVI